MSEDAGAAMSDSPDQTATTAAERSFSQADVDRIVQDRLARAKATPPADYEDLKAKAARLAELEAESMSELEKERAARAQAEERAAQVEADARETRLRAAILGEAAKADRKVVDPDAVVALLDRSTLELADDGTPTNIAEAMDSLLKARPYLVASGGTRGDADQGARGHGGVKQLSRSDLKSMSPEAIAKAEKEGRLAQLMGANS